MSALSIYAQINILMKNYTTLVRAQINGNARTIPTQIRAQNPIDAKWLLQAIYGFHAVISTPIEVREEKSITEITAAKTPEQVRLDTLKAAKDRANDALRVERDRQARKRATQTLANSNKVISTKLKA